MEIKNFKTRFALGDVVYFMYNNEISKGVITQIKVGFEENAYIPSSCIQRVIHKITGFVNKSKTNVKVGYSLIKVNNKDNFYCACAGYFKESELASSKEELFKMLTENYVL